ncbi:MAG: toll/interleukin-1 receptor domain-containing protein [Pseudomonadota bacterium]|nr:toll/interleukin-1 receptor domain-containing protein [Pseudomonadota bacterium]
MPSQSTNVFVSYSHADAPLVAPVVKLLRVNKSLVFQDIDSIQPGKRWRSELAKALAEAHLVVVFWCDHARRSNEVSKEWKAAIEQRKDLLPLLLDATPLPPELEFQWIDLREAVGASHSSIDGARWLSDMHPQWSLPIVRAAIKRIVIELGAEILRRTALRRRETARVPRALRGELQELRYTVAFVAYLIQMDCGTIDRKYLEWFRTVTTALRHRSVAGAPVAEGRVLGAVEMQLGLTDDQIATLAQHNRASTEGALSVKKYALPLLDSRVGSLWELEESLQKHLLEVRANLDRLDSTRRRSATYGGGAELLVAEPPRSRMSA